MGDILMKKMKIVVSTLILLAGIFAFFNPAPANAQTINLSSGVFVKGTLKPNGINTYQFTTNKDNGEAYITLDQTTATFSMYLYDANGNEVAYDEGYSNGDLLKIDDHLKEGTYTIKVEADDWDGISSASYQLKATYAPTDTNKRDPATLEPNDTFETAVPVTSGKIYSSSSYSEVDQDVYTFTTTKDGESYITLDQTTAGYSIKLYDSDGNVLYDDYGYRSGDRLKIDEQLKKGTYYIKINANDWGGVSNATYRLKATYPGNFTRDSTTFETNDTFETAMALDSGKAYASSSYSDIDQDVYKFTTTKDGESYITLDQTTAGFSMELYDANGNELYTDYGYDSGESLSIDKQLKKGTYYIKINPNEWDGISSATYRLKATYPGTFTRNSSTFEPNDTIETAKPLISDKAYNSNSESALDHDVYKIVTNKDGEAYIILDQTTAGFTMYLYNSNGEEVGWDESYNRGDNLKIDERLQKGTYYIKIVPNDWSGVTSASYHLKASFPDKTPSVNLISDQSTWITGYAESKSKVYAYVGNKRIGYTVATNGNYSIKIPKQAVGEMISVYLIDSTGMQSGTRTVKVLDKTAPSASLTASTNSLTNKNVSIIIKGSDGGSGIDYLKLPNGSIIKRASTIYYATKNGTYTFYVKDKAGNVTKRSITIRNIDKTAPSVPSVNNVTSKSTNVTGKSEKYSMVYVYRGSRYLGQARTSGKGTFSIRIAKQKKRTILSVLTIDQAGNKSKTKKISVK